MQKHTAEQHAAVCCGLGVEWELCAEAWDLCGWRIQPCTSELHPQVGESNPKNSIWRIQSD